MPQPTPAPYAGQPDGPAAYKFDVAAIATIGITTGAGEAAARQAASALSGIALQTAAGHHAEVDADVPPGTVFTPIWMSPRGSVHLVNATNSRGQEIKVSEVEDFPEPITDLALQELRDLLDRWKTAAGSPSGDDERDAANALADAVEALLDAAGSHVAKPPASEPAEGDAGGIKFTPPPWPTSEDVSPADRGPDGGLWRTTAVIWSHYSGDQVELSVLAREAETGDAYCSVDRSEFVPDPASDPDWDGTEFFG